MNKDQVFTFIEKQNRRKEKSKAEKDLKSEKQPVIVKTAEETVNPTVTTVSTASTILVSAATTTTAIINDITLAKALIEIKSAKPKADKVVIQEPEQSTTATTLTTTAATTIIADSTRPKAKGLVIHEQEQASTPTVSSQQPS
nr:hypothetical protein [Tanacetum cinerariifolium]